MAVNYQLDVINPFQAALQGYGAGAQILQQERTAERQVQQDAQQSQLFQAQMQEAQLRAQQARQAMANAERAQAASAKAFEAVQKGEYSSELIAETLTANPELGKFLQTERDRLNTESRQNIANQNLQVATALENNQIEIAKQLYEKRAVAFENAGDPEGAAAERAMAQQLNTPDGVDVVKTIAYMTAGSLLDSKDFDQSYKNIQAMKGEQETEAVRTARTYALTFGPPGSPEYMNAFRTKLLPPPAPGTVVNVGPTGKSLTPGQEAVDKKFGDIYAEWVTGGGADAAKQISQLNEAIATLESNKEITGPLVGLLPDGVAAFAAPELLALKESIQEVVQRNLRAVLGSQFTAPEAQQLISRAFNPSLGVPENTKRVRRLLEQMERANKATQGSIDYFQKNGTLQGYDYKFPTKAEFEAAASGKGPAPAATINFGGMDDRTLTQQDIAKLTREQRAALTAELDKRGL
jgi:hypothetical protein